MDLLLAMELSPDAIIVLDKKGHVVYWNQGAEGTFGFSSNEMMGDNIDAIMPEKLRALHNEAYDQFVRTGKSKYAPGHTMAVPAINKAGERMSVEFRISVLHDEEGHVAFVAAILRDVTKQWQREKELRKRVMECEKSLQQEK